MWLNLCKPTILSTLTWQRYDKSYRTHVGIRCNCHWKIKEIGRFRNLTELPYCNGSFLIFLAVEWCQPNMGIVNLIFPYLMTCVMILLHIEHNCKSFFVKRSRINLYTVVIHYCEPLLPYFLSTGFLLNGDYPSLFCRSMQQDSLEGINSFLVSLQGHIFCHRNNRQDQVITADDMILN